MAETGVAGVVLAVAIFCEILGSDTNTDEDNVQERHAARWRSQRSRHYSVHDVNRPRKVWAVEIGQCVHIVSYSIVYRFRIVRSQRRVKYSALHQALDVANEALENAATQ